MSWDVISILKQFTHEDRRPASSWLCARSNFLALVALKVALLQLFALTHHAFQKSKSQLLAKRAWVFSL